VFTTFQYVPYTVLSRPARAKALNGDAEVVIANGSLIAKGLNKSGETSITTLEWLKAAAIAVHCTYYHHGDACTKAALSVNILHEIVEVAQERKCIQDGNSGAQPPHLAGIKYFLQIFCPWLVVTSGSAAAHCCCHCCSLCSTVSNIARHCCQGHPKKEAINFFQKKKT
jgi:hypothetical protein